MLPIEVRRTSRREAAWDIVFGLPRGGRGFVILAVGETGVLVLVLVLEFEDEDWGAPRLPVWVMIESGESEGWEEGVGGFAFVVVAVESEGVVAVVEEEGSMGDSTASGEALGE